MDLLTSYLIKKYQYLKKSQKFPSINITPDVILFSSPAEYGFSTNKNLSEIVDFVKQFPIIKTEKALIHDYYFDTKENDLFFNNTHLRLRHFTYEKSDYICIFWMSWRDPMEFDCMPCRRNFMISEGFSSIKDFDIETITGKFKDQGYELYQEIVKERTNFILYPSTTHEIFSGKIANGFTEEKGYWLIDDAGLKISVDQFISTNPQFPDNLNSIEIEFDHKRHIDANKYKKLFQPEFIQNLDMKDNNKSFDIILSKILA